MPVSTFLQCVSIDLSLIILLNNCGGPSSIQAAVNSEFDFPKLATFYKSHADEILDNVPNSISMDVGPLNLGEYDLEKKAFPFVGPVLGYGGRPMKQPVVAEGINLGHTPLPRCGATPGNVWFGPTPPSFTAHVSFPKLTFTDFAVDESAAKDYVAFLSSVHASGRFVFLRVDMDVLNNPARMTNYGRGVDFDGKVSKITVFSTRDNHTATAPIGVLYP